MFVDNKLFNLNSIKKYFKNFELTQEKKDKLEVYIDRVNNNEFKGETKGYPAFLKFLEDILGYDEPKHINFDDNVDIGKGRVEFALKDENGKFMVIELKGQDVDLDKAQNRVNDKRTPVEQAFGYAQKSSKKSGIVDWILVSNYEEFRLYNYTKREGEYISFNIEDILKDESEFKTFLFSFSKESHIDLKVINDVISEEYIEKTKLANNFYKLFNETRLMIFKELTDLHGINKDDAISYAQTILDRFIFICFASSRDLLPEDITHKTLLDKIKNGNLRDHEIWRELNYLFIDVNKGNPDRNISKYNGGLFKKDFKDFKLKDIVNKDLFKDIQKVNKRSRDYKDFIKDRQDKLGIRPSISKRLNPIYINLSIISSFDFSDENKESNEYNLDIDILGHIFENSIGDIEELKKDSKGRRKKDGIFYTPEYITDYICKNTIIPYLSKNGNINTVDDLLQEYSIGRDVENLDKKLLNIKIIDPACGSGAFLNKATDILLEIHERIFEVKKGYTTSTSMRVGKGRKRRTEDVQHIDLSAYVFDDMGKRREILSDNIYGVDLNSESVEITKLSLFLKVCEKDHELPKLDNNIKCGNSLINDSELAGKKAFKWEEKFKDIFRDGGFDIVIGNPPYVGEKGNKDTFRNVKGSFLGEYYQGKMDLFYFFFHLSLNITKNNGRISFITTNYYTTATTGTKLRQDLKNRSTIQKLINFNELKIFESAKGQHNMITFLSKSKSNSKTKNCITKRKGLATPNILQKILNSNDSETEYFEVKQSNIYDGDENYIRLRGTDIENDPTQTILNKIKSKGELITEFCDVKVGLRSGIDKISEKHLEIDDSYNLNDEVFIVSNDFFQIVPPNEKILLKPFYKNSDIHRYYNEKYTDKYVLYIRKETDINKFPFLKSHLEKFKPLIEKIRGTDGENWYSLVRPRNEQIFTSPKIVIPYRSKYNDFSYNEYKFYCSSDVYFIIYKKNEKLANLKYILTLLNSKLYYLWLSNKGKMKGESLELYKKPLTEIPIIKLSFPEQKPFIEKADKMLQLNKKLLNEINGFKGWLKSKYKPENFSNELDKYFELSFDDFLDELNNKNVDTTVKDYKLLKKEFENNLEVINPLIQKIEQTDNEINQMVYELYGLTEKEIKIVEDSINS